MGRPREFDEVAALEAATLLFWARGYAGASTRELTDAMGLNTASFYNAFGDKRALYRRILRRYADGALTWCAATLAGQDSAAGALRVFFEALAQECLANGPTQGCLVVNATLEGTADHPEVQALASEVFGRIEVLFRRCVRRGQDEGSITRAMPEDLLGSLLLSALIGLRLLARTDPDTAQVRRLVTAATALLEPR